jgi:hypothetical protein
MQLQLWTRLKLRLRLRLRLLMLILRDREIDRRHRSFLSAVLGEDVGHVRSRTTRMLLPIHDLWVPKYMN